MVSHPGHISYCSWMVSHPGQILIVDGWCPILVMAPELQEETIGTKGGSSNVHISLIHTLIHNAREILVMAPELQEDGMVQRLSATVH